MESIYHIVTIRVNETSWAHVWRLRSLYLGMGYDIDTLIFMLWWAGAVSKKSASGHIMMNMCFCIWWDLRITECIMCVQGTNC
jgi:hypothetical protein